MGDLEHTVASRFRRPSGLFCRAFFSLMMSPLLACLNAFAPTLAASQPISSANVSTLRPVLVFRTGSPRGHAGSPTVSGDTLFVLTPFPHTLYAFDTRRLGLSTEVDIPPEGGRPSGRTGVLRHVERRTNDLGKGRFHHDSRRPCYRARRGNRKYALGCRTRRSCARRDTDRRPRGRGSLRAGRRQRRRLWRTGLDRGARCRDGTRGLASVQHGPGPGRRHRHRNNSDRGRTGCRRP